MAEQSRKRKKPAKKRPAKYFFLNGLLHKIIFISRPHDLVWAWSYEEKKRKQYSWSYVKDNYKMAFTTVQVAGMINRDRRTISNYFMDKKIPIPPHTYGLTEVGRTHAYMWDEKRVLDLHEYLLSVSIGRPRKDGIPRIKPMPTRAELLAMMRQESITYVKNDEGEFTPAWRQPEW